MVFIEHHTAIVVLYHNDLDGNCGAWAIEHARRGSDAFPDVRYECADYGRPRRQADEHETCLVFVDFAPTPDELEAALESGREVMILDHHHRPELEGIKHERLTYINQPDAFQCGASLAWRRFHALSSTMPWLVNYTRDRDLWRFALPTSREVCEVLMGAVINPEAGDWQAFDELNKQTISEVAVAGERLLERVRIDLDFILKEAHTIKLKTPAGSMRVPAVCAQHRHSDLGERLLRMQPDAPFVVIYRMDSTAQWRFSLRARQETPYRYPVNVVAAFNGGGGRNTTAGFVADLEGGAAILSTARSLTWANL